MATVANRASLLAAIVLALTWADAVAQEPPQEGFLDPPSVAAILEARRYDDLVLVLYNVDYAEVSGLPAASDAWWVDGQVGVNRVSAAQPVAYTRNGWGHGLLSLRHSPAITQVTLTGMPNRYAAPLDVTVPVTPGTDLGADLLLALRGLEAMPEWEDHELVVGEWLGSDGQAYVEAVVPNIRERAPEIYAVRIVDVHRPSFTPTARTNQGILPIEALNGLTGDAAQSLRLPEVMFRLMLIALLSVVAAGAAVKMGDSGMLAIPAVGIVVLGGTIIGFVPLALTLTLGLFAAVVLGFALFGKRA